jgi:hypothetical protein
MSRLLKIILLTVVLLSSGWGFFAHRKINQLAVFILPPPMIGFYKKNIEYLSETSINPDSRRYAMADEAPRHYIDLDDYGDSAVFKLPRYWNQAVKKIGVDSLAAHGIVPWHITKMYDQLKDAFMVRDPNKILRFSAELGHYIADANVPLHTTGNYDGQKTGQTGIHVLWESRLPELHFVEYDFFVGKAAYVPNIQLAAWAAIERASAGVDSVLRFEKELSEKMTSKKFSFETKGRQTVKIVSVEYSKAYHQLLSGMVERQFRASVKMAGDAWYSAWVDAGQPDLKEFMNYTPTKEELLKREEELKKWKDRIYLSRQHEIGDN